MVQRKYRKDDVVFQRGDVTNELFWIESGKFLVGGTLIEIQAGRFFGELGIFAQGNQRTQTVKCTEDGNVRAITYEKLLELFLDPKFSYSAFGFLLGAK